MEYTFLLFLIGGVAIMFYAINLNNDYTESLKDAHLLKKEVRSKEFSSASRTYKKEIIEEKNDAIYFAKFFYFISRFMFALGIMVCVLPLFLFVL